MSIQWYLAELVMKLTVANDTRNEVHQNVFLIQADSPDEAYEKALKFGRREETSYLNSVGNVVRISFEGISDLVDVVEELVDGAELMFRRKVNVTEKKLRSMVLPKERLRVFLPRQRANGPDFASAEVLALLERELGGEQGFPLSDQK